MVKNERLPANIITPTTKAADHDIPITPDEVCLYSVLCFSIIYPTFNRVNSYCKFCQNEVVHVYVLLMFPVPYIL